MTIFSSRAHVATSARKLPNARRPRRSSGFVSSRIGLASPDCDDELLNKSGDFGVMRDALDDARLREPLAIAAIRSSSFCLSAASWKWSYVKPSCSALRRPVRLRFRRAVRFAKVSMLTSTSARKRLRSLMMVSSVTPANSRNATTTAKAKRLLSSSWSFRLARFGYAYTTPGTWSPAAAASRASWGAPSRRE